MVNERGGLDDVLSGGAAATSTAQASREDIADQGTGAMGGYSAAAHRRVFEKTISDIQRKSLDDLTADQIWKNHDKKLAESMEIVKDGSVEKYILDSLNAIGIKKAYEFKVDRVVKKFMDDEKKIRNTVSSYQTILDGKARYVGPAENTNLETVLQKNKYIRESEKGLRYKIAEATDEAKILMFQYRNGEIAVGNLRTQIGKIDEDISQLNNNQSDSGASAKVGKLLNQKQMLENEKSAVEDIQRRYTEVLQNYEEKLDRVSARVTFYETIVNKAQKELRTVQSAIEVIADYRQMNKKDMGASMLMQDLIDLGKSRDTIRKGIKHSDDVMKNQLSLLKYSESGPNGEYATRELIEEMDQLKQENEVETKQDMSRFAQKLGIQIE